VTLSSHFSTALESLTLDKKQLVLAYSGGLDSHVLLHLLAQYKHAYPQHEYLAVHVHHGLSDNADTWLVHCRNTAELLDVAFVAEKVQLNIGNRESLEATARAARYQAIAKHLSADSVLLLGQHVDDQLETFLLQLKRGAGVKGLSAMAANMPFIEVSGAQICRPLLTATQTQLQEYAQAQQLIWVEDESNQDQSYDRNFLRQHIIPELKQRWPNIAKTVHRTAELCAEQQSLADEIAGEDFIKVVSLNESLMISELAQLSLARRNNLIRYWLAQQGEIMPSRLHLQKLWAEVVNASDDANPQLSWQGGQFRRYQGRLYNVKKFADLSGFKQALSMQELDTANTTFELPDDLGQLQLSVVLGIEKTKGEALRSQPLPLIMMLKPAKVGQVVSIGFRGEGKCKPAGRNGSRSIKKLYQEYQVAPWLRDRVPLIYYDDKLVCALGLWICEGYEDGNGWNVIWRK